MTKIQYSSTFEARDILSEARFANSKAVLITFTEAGLLKSDADLLKSEADLFYFANSV